MEHIPISSFTLFAFLVSGSSPFAHKSQRLNLLSPFLSDHSGKKLGSFHAPAPTTLKDHGRRFTLSPPLLASSFDACSFYATKFLSPSHFNLSFSLSLSFLKTHFCNIVSFLSPFSSLTLFLSLSHSIFRTRYTTSCKRVSATRASGVAIRESSVSRTVVGQLTSCSGGNSKVGDVWLDLWAPLRLSVSIGLGQPKVTSVVLFADLIDRGGNLL